MLCARGETRVGSAGIASHLALDRDVLLYTVRRDGVCYDTRFVPASREPAQPVVLAWLIRRGELRWGNAPARHDRGPLALVMPESCYEGANGRRAVDFHACGPMFEAVDVRWRAEWSPPGAPRVDGVQVVSLGEAAWAAVEQYSHAVLAQPTTDGAARAAAEALLRALGDRGLVQPGVVSSLATGHDQSMDALWASIRAAFGPLDPSPSLKTLAADMGLSLRQTARVVALAKRGLLTPPGGWRDTIRTLRTKLAVVLLSCAELPIGEIASTVGYQRPEAMANAFQHDGLPPPREVRRLLLAVHEASTTA